MGVTDEQGFASLPPERSVSASEPAVRSATRPTSASASARRRLWEGAGKPKLFQGSRACSWSTSLGGSGGRRCACTRGIAAKLPDIGFEEAQVVLACLAGLAVGGRKQLLPRWPSSSAHEGSRGLARLWLGGRAERRFSFACRPGLQVPFLRLLDRLRGREPCIRRAGYPFDPCCDLTDVVK